MTQPNLIQDYQDFAHTGPGTLAGRFMRTFWQPISLSRDLQRGDALPLRIMGEGFTLYRGESGKPYVVAERCAHRGTQLSTGWVEGECIRCFYHGWMYDGSGQCVDQPAESPEFAPKVRIRSYPTLEYLGLIFAYLGEGEPPPPLCYPDLEQGDGVVDVGTGVLPYNYFNGVENSVDTVHVGFVHRESGFYDAGVAGVPSVAAEETEFGLRLDDRMPNGKVRVTLFEMPTIIHLKAFPLGDTGWRDFMSWKVPIDDVSFRSFFIVKARVNGEAAKRYLQNENRCSGFISNREDIELGEAILAGRSKRRQEVIGARARRVSLQDYVAQRGQGTIADREHERLGRSDACLILLRRVWSRELQAIAEGKPLRKWCWRGDTETTTGV